MPKAKKYHLKVLNMPWSYCGRALECFDEEILFEDFEYAAQKNKLNTICKSCLRCKLAFLRRNIQVEEKRLRRTQKYIQKVKAVI